MTRSRIPRRRDPQWPQQDFLLGPLRIWLVRVRDLPLLVILPHGFAAVRNPGTMRFTGCSKFATGVCEISPIPHCEELTHGDRDQGDGHSAGPAGDREGWH